MTLELDTFCQEEMANEREEEAETANGEEEMAKREYMAKEEKEEMAKEEDEETTKYLRLIQIDILKYS